jgi:glycosyltransferase involved in cell wall biosynthesis
MPRIVSVVVATRDRPKLLANALASIRALEGPDLQFEILLGDNGGLRETREVAERFGAIHQLTTKDGCAAARNAVLGLASGEFIAFLDDDDLWLPDNIRGHIDLLDKRPELAGVLGQVVSTDPNLVPEGPPWPTEEPADGDFFMAMMNGYCPQVGATVLRADVVQTHGFMDEDLLGGCDWDWQISIARDRPFGFVSKPCVLFRQRAPGAFNGILLKRSAYMRRIFFRHSVANRERWSSWRAILSSYYNCQMYFWWMFCELARTRAARGERMMAARALACALWICPPRTLRGIFRNESIKLTARSIVLGAASRAN